MNTSTNTREMSTANKTLKTMTKMKQKLLEDEYNDLVWSCEERTRAWESLVRRETTWDGTEEGRKALEQERVMELWKPIAEAIDAPKEARMAEIEALLEECGCECMSDEEVEALETARRLQEEFYVKQLGETEGKLRAAKVWAELAEQEDEEDEA